MGSATNDSSARERRWFRCDDPARTSTSPASERCPLQHLLPEAAAEPRAPAAREFIESSARKRMEDVAYSRLRSTKPQTVALGLTDSPAGLAACVVDLVRTFSDCGGEIESRLTPTNSSATKPFTGSPPPSVPRCLATSTTSTSRPRQRPASGSRFRRASPSSPTASARAAHALPYEWPQDDRRARGDLRCLGWAQLFGVLGGPDSNHCGGRQPRPADTPFQPRQQAAEVGDELRQLGKNRYDQDSKGARPYRDIHNGEHWQSGITVERLGDLGTEHHGPARSPPTRRAQPAQPARAPPAAPAGRGR